MTNLVEIFALKIDKMVKKLGYVLWLIWGLYPKLPQMVKWIS